MADHTDLIRNAYKTRAAIYDDGWHTDLADDFVRWLNPQPGEFVLDLACGTGLLTIPLAAHVGKKGRVVAIDLTNEMLKVAQEKEAQPNACNIDWMVADIASETLLDIPKIRAIVDEHGGFDIISVCSALVLLPDQHGAVTFWVQKLLKKGGRLIIDVPTETITLQLLRTYYLPKAIGYSFDLAKGRLWIKGKHSLEDLFKGVGLEIEQSLVTRSYANELWHAPDEETALKILMEEVKGNLQWVDKEGKLEDAKSAWPRLWENAAVQRPGGQNAVYDGHQLYVCVGRKTL